MADEGGSAQLEIRASWTPEGDIGPHVEAWGELMCTAVGLEPVPGRGHRAAEPTRPARRTMRREDLPR